MEILMTNDKMEEKDYMYLKIQTFLKNWHLVNE